MHTNTRFDDEKRTYQIEQHVKVRQGSYPVGTYQSTKIKKMDCLIYQNADNIMLLYFLVIVTYLPT